MRVSRIRACETIEEKDDVFLLSSLRVHFYRDTYFSSLIILMSENASQIEFHRLYRTRQSEKLVTFRRTICTIDRAASRPFAVSRDLQREEVFRYSGGVAGFPRARS